MKLTLRHCVDMGDWYVIERAEHDGRTWWEPTEYGKRFMTSARFSDADVEGSAEEMLAIADAIERRESVRFKRCAVVATRERVEFESPRNSTRPGFCSLAEADELAREIRAVVATNH